MAILSSRSPESPLALPRNPVRNIGQTGMASGALTYSTAKPALPGKASCAMTRKSFATGKARSSSGLCGLVLHPWLASALDLPEGGAWQLYGCATGVQHPSHGGDGGAPDGPRAPAPAGAPVGAVGAPSGCATSCSVTGRYSARVLRIFLRVIEQSLQSLSPSAAQVAQGKWGSSAYRRSGFHPPV